VMLTISRSPLARAAARKQGVPERGSLPLMLVGVGSSLS
jgi:hypothetical protein